MRPQVLRTADFRRLVILTILTALAIMLCDRLSEAEAPKASQPPPPAVTAALR